MAAQREPSSATLRRFHALALGELRLERMTDLRHDREAHDRSIAFERVQARFRRGMSTASRGRDDLIDHRRRLLQETAEAISVVHQSLGYLHQFAVLGLFTFASQTLGHVGDHDQNAFRVVLPLSSGKAR